MKKLESLKKFETLNEQAERRILGGAPNWTVEYCNTQCPTSGGTDTAVNKYDFAGMTCDSGCDSLPNNNY